jgi:hypothetical protein
MNRLLLLTLLVVSFGCSNKISEHFKQNTYDQQFNMHILNSSLQLAIESPSDITYTTEKKALRKVIRNSDFKLKDRLLIYGKTDEPPYEYFVTISSTQKQNYPENLIVYDTLIDTHTIQFLGNPLHVDSRRALAIDLENIFRSLKVGEGYTN